MRTPAVAIFVGVTLGSIPGDGHLQVVTGEQLLELCSPQVSDAAHAICLGYIMGSWTRQQYGVAYASHRPSLEAEAKAPPADDDGPGPSTGMVDHGKPRRAPDGGPPERAQRNFTDPDSASSQPGTA